MSALQHRAPGLVGAVLDHDSVTASIIPDGHHVDYAAIRIAKKIMKDRLFAITDSVTTTTEGPYQHVLAGDKYEAGNILSGSSLTMGKAVQNLVNFAGIRLEEALLMCSLYPAKIIGLNGQGLIEKGGSPRMVVLDESLDVKQLL
jgi:N-acetylglucosamine-6-phosphate deacetylase